MENAHTLTEPAAPGNPFMARMKAMAEALLDAIEAVPVPKDYAGIGKAARTLISLDRLIKALWSDGTVKSSKRKTPQSPAMTDDATGLAGLKDALSEVLNEAETDPPPPLNRQQRRREEKLRRVAKIPERTAFAMSP